MANRSTLAAAARIAADFVMGVVLFALVATFVMTGHGMAVAGPDHGAGIASFWVEQSGIGWHPLTRDAAILVLAVTFGAVTAFNMAIARHLHAAVKPSARAAETAQADSADPHVNY